jgi:hypothetical protein
MTVHFLWNLSGSLPLGLLGLIIALHFVEVPLILGVLVLVFFALRREGRIVRYYLTAELQTRLLTQEHDSLSSVDGCLSMSFNALTNGSFGA